MGTIHEGPRESVATNLGAIRRRRGLTVRALSERLAEYGVNLLPSGVTKIEQGQRGVDVGELIALAAALNVSPAQLLLPDVAGLDDDVPLTPTLTASVHQAWRWMEGLDALPRPDAPMEDVYDRSWRRIEPADVMAFQDARPSYLREREGHPLARAVARLTHATSWATSSRAEDIAWARQELERVSAELDTLEQEASRG